MRELSQLDVEDLGRPQSEAIMRANDLDTANSDDTANGDDDNARRRVAKRRARHDRAIANAFGSEKAIRYSAKIICANARARGRTR
jgi:hypothetical protein